MKRFYTCIVALLLALSFSGCSKNDPQAVNGFLKALNNTWTEDSLYLSGTLKIDASFSGTSEMELYLDQTDQVALLFVMNLEAYGSTIDPFLMFCIKDGRTYLDSAGTKSQSLAANIGLGEGKKISVWDPFLSLTDKEQQELFSSAVQDGDEYTLELNKDKLSVYLDEMGGATVSKATIDALVEDGLVKKLVLDFEGSQNIDGKIQDVALKADVDVVQAGGKLDIPFPDDLESY